MSEAIASNPVPQEQVESVPVVEQTPAAPAETTAVEQEEKDPKAVGDSHVKKIVKLIQSGERGLKSGYFSAGKESLTYIRKRVKAGQERDAAVSTLEGEINRYSSIHLTVNRLIGAHFAHELLDPTDSFPTVSYTHYSDVWSKLTRETDYATADESRSLLTGYEDKCKELFAKCSTPDEKGDLYTRSACDRKVQEFIKEWKRFYAGHANVAKQEAVKLQTELQTEAETAAANAKALQEALDKAEESKKAEAQAQLDAAEKDRKEKAERARLAAEEVKETTKEAKNAESALNRLKKKENSPPRNGDNRPEHKPIVSNLIDNGVAAAKVATPQTLAESIVVMIENSSDPETVIEQVLRRLVKLHYGKFSEKGKRALQAANVIFSRNENLTPEKTVNVNRNGHVVAVPA